MQDQNPTIFTKRGSYDGNKNLFSLIKYPFGESAKFAVNDPIRPNRWRVLIQQVDTINPQFAARDISGKLSLSKGTLTTVKACNVTAQTQPLQSHILHRQALFSRAGFQDTGRGLELWRGYFQSVRPMIGKMVITVDISSVAVYKSGPLIKVCLEYLECSPEANPSLFLNEKFIQKPIKEKLIKYLRNLKIRDTSAGSSTAWGIKNISMHGADSFLLKTGDREISMAAYFRERTGRPLRYPSLVCVQVSSKNWLPLEYCDVVPGQIFRKKLKDRPAQDLTYFSTSEPDLCLQRIKEGLQELGYSDSKYLRDFGMNVDPNPMTIKGRILPAPTLRFGRNVTIQPRDGRWDMWGKPLYKPAYISGCAIIIYDQSYRLENEQYLKRNLASVAGMLGIRGMPNDPPVLRKVATGTEYLNHMREVAMLHKAVKGDMPNLIIVLLPAEGGKDIYLRIKSAGDIKIGVATQCLRSLKCSRSNVQYLFNVFLKINAKLGGINFIPRIISFINNVANSIIVIGANIKRGRPGRAGGASKPSYTAIVGNVDSELGKYVAISRPQDYHLEVIENLADMVSDIINMYIRYQKTVEGGAEHAPQRILFYRDGLSEGQFKTHQDFEVAQIFKACDRVGIPRPKLTYVIVGRSHRIRFFPPPGGRSNWKGNFPSGLVIDREITSPVEYDFYLQSQPGLNGTSRSTHYNVILDENIFIPDDLQRISFSLCHVNARSTSSASVVTPVQYASMACRRARTHSYLSSELDEISDAKPQPPPTTLDARQPDASQLTFRPVHPNTGMNMYFI